MIESFETLNIRQDGGVLFAEIDAPPMNLLGPALIRDLVSLVEQVAVARGGAGPARHARRLAA